ncbi:MAG: hypothetical protein ACRD0K_02430 [Egibacteraceae bacterium]
MADDDRVLVEAARAVRYYLPGLVDDPAEAEEVDAALMTLLERDRAGEDVLDELAELFQRHDGLLEWVAVFLETGLPPDLAPADEKGISPLPGAGSPVALDRFVCPVGGDYVRWRRNVGEVLTCPRHGVALVPADA